MGVLKMQCCGGISSLKGSQHKPWCLGKVTATLSEKGKETVRKALEKAWQDAHDEFCDFAAAEDADKHPVCKNPYAKEN